jgi:uncharacterized glyoxalase superfamily protein PhnB
MTMSPFTPTVFYRDPIAALKWLEQAFGFETTMLVEGQDGSVAHSELRLGDGVIMVGSEWSDDNKSPASLGGKNTQAIHLQIDTDIDAHCERARKAGARITQEPVNEFYGERIYRALDPEGHVWVFAQATQALSFEEMEKATGLKFSTKLDEVTS